MVVGSVGSIEKSVHLTNRWIKDVQDVLECDSDEAFLALRSTLELVRDRLTVEEATDFGAQLPNVLKGVYYEHWNPAGKPEKMDRTAFVSRFHSSFDNDPEIDPARMVSGVLHVLSSRMPEEMNQVKANLPKDIRALA